MAKLINKPFKLNKSTSFPIINIFRDGGSYSASKKKTKAIPIPENPSFYINEDNEIKIKKEQEKIKQRLEIGEEAKRRIAAGISTLGYGISLIPHPLAIGLGLLMQGPDLLYDIKDSYNKRRDTTVSDVILDATPDIPFSMEVQIPLYVGKLGFDFSKPIVKKFILPFGLMDAIGDAEYAINGKEEPKSTYVLPEIVVTPTSKIITKK